MYGSAAAGGRNTWRAVGVLGLLVLACAYRGGPDGKAWMTHQWWGILGLIGWSYLISASVYLAARARIAVLLVATAACIAVYALCHAFPAASYPNWADLTDCGGLVCETSLTLLGVVTSLVFFARPGERAPRAPLRPGGALIVACVVAGALLRPAYTISKIYASPTWCLYSAAICIALFAALHVAGRPARARALGALAGAGGGASAGGLPDPVRGGRPRGRVPGRRSRTR